MGNISEDFKQNVFKVLSEVLLRAMEDGQITADESKQASIFILDTVDNMQSHGEFYGFMDKLMTTWIIFSPICLKIREEMNQFQKKETLNKINSDLKQLMTN